MTGIASDSIVLIPIRLTKIAHLYELAKRRRVSRAIVADSYGVGERGELEGYHTLIVSPVRLSKGIGLVDTSAIIWHIGRNAGYRISLATGHEIIASEEQELLVHGPRGLTHAPVHEIASDTKQYKIPIYMLTFPRRERADTDKAVLVAILLLSRQSLTDNKLIKITPLSDDIRWFIEYVVSERKDCGVKIEDGDFVVGTNCIDVSVPFNRISIDILIEYLSLPTLSEAAYIVGTVLHKGVRLTAELEKRLPLLAFLLQFAGWIVEREGNILKARRHRSPVYYSSIEKVEKVSDNFYSLTVLEGKYYLANGFVLAV